MESSKPESEFGFASCSGCREPLRENAIYCGACGRSVSEPDGNKEPGFQTPSASAAKSYWQWIYPAIRLWVSLLFIYGLFGLFSHIFDLSSPFYDLGIQTVAILFILTACLNSRKELSPLVRSFGFRGLPTFVEIAGTLFLIFVFMWLYFKLASFAGIQQLTYLQDFKKHNWPLWNAFLLICLLPGIFEELAFRGFIMARMEKVGTVKEALVIQAAMFSVLHLLPANFISHFVIGLILGLVRMRSRSLYPSMIIHTLWNAIVISGEIFV